MTDLNVKTKSNTTNMKEEEEGKNLRLNKIKA
jgi:hypothetical protein